MSLIITSFSHSPWLQQDCILETSTLETLAKRLPFPVLFGSQDTNYESRYCIFSAAPKQQITLHLAQEISVDKSILTKFKDFANCYTQQTIPEHLQTLPFVCGLIGYCSYRSGELTQELSPKLDIDFPDLFLGAYSWSYVFDRQTQTGRITFSPACTNELRTQILNIIASTSSTPFKPRTANTQLQWHKSQRYERYRSAFNAIHDYINAGDCYQTNLTQRFDCKLDALRSEFSAINYYLDTQSKLQTPYSAFLSFEPDVNLMCFSPEQFIRIQNREIESKPIKGTMVNNSDLSNIDRLKDSLKNQAENVMIVDLLRNDLSKVCEVNSVHVPELFKIESYKNVHHMVSQIRGKLREGITEFDAFLSCFPGGSITGAPKRRAMEIIQELEVHSRSAYCGSVFYWNDNGHFDSNILIRSIIQTGDKLYCWAGGGIVSDSDVDDEYLESLTKVANLTGISE